MLKSRDAHFHCANGHAANIVRGVVLLVVCFRDAADGAWLAMGVDRAAGYYLRHHRRRVSVR